MIQSCIKHTFYARSMVQSDDDHGFVKCSYDESPHPRGNWAKVSVHSKSDDRCALFNAKELRALADGLAVMAKLMEAKEKANG